MRRLLATVMLLSSLPAAGVNATQSATTIPKELVALLLRGPGTFPNDSFDIRIGAPPGFPRELLPKGVLPAASTVSERGTTVVAEAPQLTARDLTQHERDLTDAGWSHSSSMSMRGLVSSNTSPTSSMCKGDQYVTTAYSQRPAGGLYLRVSVTTDPRRGMCAGPGQRPASFFADVTLPNLTPPSGARAMGSGTSSGSDSYAQHVRLETTLNPEALVRHYGDQLEQVGWKRESVANAGSVAIARFTMVSTTKDTVVAILMATAMPDGAQTDVGLRLLRIDPNRRFPSRIGGLEPR